MKFGRHYKQYMNSEGQSSNVFPSVDFKKLKKLLKRCSDRLAQIQQQQEQQERECGSMGEEAEKSSNANQDESSRLPLEHHENLDHDAGAESFRGALIPGGLVGGQSDRFMSRMSTTRVMITDEGCDGMDDPRRSDARLSFGLLRCASADGASSSACRSPCCPDCDPVFFTDIDNAVQDVVACFNARAKELLWLRRSPRVVKTLLRFTVKTAGDRGSMLQAGNEVVCYGCLNAIAIRKLLKKYDKIHNSGHGRDFKTQLQARRVELLQSPLLIEMGALAVNLMDSQAARPFSRSLPAGFYSVCSFDPAKRTIAFAVQTGLQLDFDITCSICLEIVFDPIALACGHIFCNSCVCGAGFVPVFQGARSAKRNCKCPLCRQIGVFKQAIFMSELWVLVKLRCPTYYKERIKEERKQRVQEEKLFWEKQSRIFDRLY